MVTEKDEINLPRHQVAALSAAESDNFALTRKCQRSDPLCKNIIYFLENGKRHENDKTIRPLWLKEIDFYHVENGILNGRVPYLKSCLRSFA